MATKTEATPRALQIITLAVVGGAFAVQWAFVLSTALQQLQTNTNLSSYFSFFVGQAVVPVVFFAGAYLLNPRTISKVGKLFESLLIMLVGQTVVQMAVQCAYMLQASFAPTTNADQTYWNFVVYDIVAVAVTTVFYFAALLALRRTKRWK